MNNGSKPLENPKHERFALLLASGEVSASEAYRLRVSAKGTAKSSHEAASRLAESVKVASRIQWLKAEAVKKAEQKAGAVTLSMAEKLEFCARVVKLNTLEAIDEEKNGDLVNGVEFGEFGRKLKIPCKLAAMKLHNDLAGDGAEAKGQSALAALVSKLRK
jgi:hypothetical protein